MSIFRRKPFVSPDGERGTVDPRTVCAICNSVWTRSYSLTYVDETGVTLTAFSLRLCRTCMDDMSVARWGRLMRRYRNRPRTLELP